jgi:hypothetical protein
MNSFKVGERCDNTSVDHGVHELSDEQRQNFLSFVLGETSVDHEIHKSTLAKFGSPFTSIVR